MTVVEYKHLILSGLLLAIGIAWGVVRPTIADVEPMTVRSMTSSGLWEERVYVDPYTGGEVVAEERSMGTEYCVQDLYIESSGAITNGRVQLSSDDIIIDCE